MLPSTTTQRRFSRSWLRDRGCRSAVALLTPPRLLRHLIPSQSPTGTQSCYQRAMQGVAADSSSACPRKSSKGSVVSLLVGWRQRTSLSSISHALCTAASRLLTNVIGVQLNLMRQRSHRRCQRSVFVESSFCLRSVSVLSASCQRPRRSRAYSGGVARVARSSHGCAWLDTPLLLGRFTSGFGLPRQTQKKRFFCLKI